MHDKTALSFHTLAGYNNVWQTFMNNKNSYVNFSLKLGASLDFNFNNSGLRFVIDNYMVLGDGNTTNNFGFRWGQDYALNSNSIPCLLLKCQVKFQNIYKNCLCQQNKITVFGPILP